MRESDSSASRRVELTRASLYHDSTNQNMMSTHTDAGCTQQTTGFTGTFACSSCASRSRPRSSPSLLADTANPALANTCDVATTSNQGCGVRSPSTKSLFVSFSPSLKPSPKSFPRPSAADPRLLYSGASFNQAQGGVYALQWDTTGLRTYFWPRSAIPADIAAGAPTGNGWGTPANYVSSTGCPSTHFVNHVFVLNTNLCGTWGAGVWNDSKPKLGGRLGKLLTVFSSSSPPRRLPLFFRPFIRRPELLLRRQNGLRDLRGLRSSERRSLSTGLLGGEGHQGVCLIFPHIEGRRGSPTEGGEGGRA